MLSSAYFAPIQWYQKLNRYDVCLIEQHDNFVKQTYRNRCVIAAANGPQTLSVPVEKFVGLKCQMKEVRISDHANWRHQHWNALQSAYGESPFFEFYADDIRPFFERKWTFLYDFNWEITLKMCELIDIMPCMRRTDTYETASPDGTDDYREVIRPKHPGQTRTLCPAGTIRSISRNSDSSLTSASSTCCSTRETRVFCICRWAVQSFPSGCLATQLSPVHWGAS